VCVWFCCSKSYFSVCVNWWLQTIYIVKSLETCRFYFLIRVFLWYLSWRWFVACMTLSGFVRRYIGCYSESPWKIPKAESKQVSLQSMYWNTVSWANSRQALFSPFPYCLSFSPHPSLQYCINCHYEWVFTSSERNQLFGSNAKCCNYSLHKPSV